MDGAAIPQYGQVSEPSFDDRQAAPREVAELDRLTALQIEQFGIRSLFSRLEVLEEVHE